MVCRMIRSKVKVKVTGASEVPKIALSKVYLLRHLQWELANDHRFLNYGTISKFAQARFFYIFPTFCVT